MPVLHLAGVPMGHQLAADAGHAGAVVHDVAAAGLADGAVCQEQCSVCSSWTSSLNFGVDLVERFAGFIWNCCWQYLRSLPGW